MRSGAADVAVLRAPFDQRGLDTEVLLAEPRVVVLPSDHRLARRRRLSRADLAGEPMPRWAERVSAATAAYWTGTDTAPAPSPPRSPPRRQRAPSGPDLAVSVAPGRPRAPGSAT